MEAPPGERPGTHGRITWRAVSWDRDGSDERIEFSEKRDSEAGKLLGRYRRVNGTMGRAV